MPLHLLGKKSWNVYNTANIERVRRDEAAAAAQEAAEEQRMQEEDAHRRLQLLRGVSPSDLPPLQPPKDEASLQRGSQPRPGHDQKRRKLHGEDDTDRDIRYAKEAQEPGGDGSSKPQLQHKSSDAPLMDRDGHVALFAPEPASAPTPKGEADAKEKRKSRPQKDTSFKAAAGEAPWYSTSKRGEPIGPPGGDKDAWGNDDPRRQERDMKRVASTDPLLAMKRGVEGVRKADKEKKRAKEERDREISDMIGEERRRERRRRHAEHRSHHRRREEGQTRRASSGQGDSDSLEGFRLDDPPREERSRRHRRREHKSRGDRDGHSFHRR